MPSSNRIETVSVASGPCGGATATRCPEPSCKRVGLCTLANFCAPHLQKLPEDRLSELRIAQLRARGDRGSLRRARLIEQKGVLGMMKPTSGSKTKCPVEKCERGGLPQLGKFCIDHFRALD